MASSWQPALAIFLGGRKDADVRYRIRFGSARVFLQAEGHTAFLVRDQTE
jgi:hypothetical protein